MAAAGEATSRPALRAGPAGPGIEEIKGKAGRHAMTIFFGLRRCDAKPIGQQWEAGAPHGGAVAGRSLEIHQGGTSRPPRGPVSGLQSFGGTRQSTAIGHARGNRMGRRHRPRSPLLGAYPFLNVGRRPQTVS